jgi:hypothetical protein
VGCTVHIEATSPGEDSVASHSIHLSQKRQEHP